MLADEPGQLAIRSLFSENAPFVLAVEGMDNSEARSLAALMENEAVLSQSTGCPTRRQAPYRPELEWLSDRPNCGLHHGGPDRSRTAELRGGHAGDFHEAGRKRPQAQHRQI